MTNIIRMCKIGTWKNLQTVDLDSKYPSVKQTRISTFFSTGDSPLNIISFDFTCAYSVLEFYELKKALSLGVRCLSVRIFPFSNTPKNGFHDIRPFTFFLVMSNSSCMMSTIMRGTWVDI